MRAPTRDLGQPVVEQARQRFTIELGGAHRPVAQARVYTDVQQSQAATDANGDYRLGPLGELRGYSPKVHAERAGDNVGAQQRRDADDRRGRQRAARADQRFGRIVSATQRIGRRFEFTRSSRVPLEQIETKMRGARRRCHILVSEH